MSHIAYITKPRVSAGGFYVVKDAFNKLKPGPVNIILGPSSTIVLEGKVKRLDIRAQGYCTCRDLYRTTFGTITAALPLRFEDILEYKIVKGNIQLLAIHRTSGSSSATIIRKSKAVVPVTAMKPIAPIDRRLNAALVLRWAALYPFHYDKYHYNPWISSARKGNKKGLRKITEWKNGDGLKPMPFLSHKQKEKAFQKLLVGLKRYLKPSGQIDLQKDFSHIAPVWSIFWAHVFYGSPIFDVYTNVAFQYFSKSARLSKKAAKISAPGHWNSFSAYRDWFLKQLHRLQKANPRIDARTLDRALFKWGEHYCV